MPRPPFDPEKMNAKRAASSSPAKVPAPGDPGAPISVSRLATLIDDAMRSGVPRPVRVLGEVGSLTERTHWYFTLKDADAVVSCVMFKSAARSAAFRPDPGLSIVASGHVEFYAPQGRVSLRVESIEPVGAGALDLAFRRLCEEIRALGWFAPERKRPMPAMPRRIAVITSRTGAALQDVLDTARRRAPFVEIMLIDTLVQGAAAAPGIAGAIAWVSANAPRLGIDALIVTRGGGSAEDLWAFNDRAVAEAIVRCSIPVAAAIGHETDTTIAELVADLRGATPTQAAMRCTPDAAALREQADALRSRLGATLRSSFRRAADAVESARRHLARALPARAERAGRSLERLAARLQAQRPDAVVERRRSATEIARSRLAAAIAARLRAADLGPHARDLARAIDSALRHRRHRAEAAERALTLVGPLAVLARGYSITFTSSGVPIRRAADARSGERITTRLADGSLRSIVEGSDAAGASPSASPAPPTTQPGATPRPPHPGRRPSRKPQPPDQPGLFGGA